MRVCADLENLLARRHSPMHGRFVSDANSGVRDWNLISGPPSI